MEQKSIIIIGAGIAGLSAGCYGQMNGYRTQIFEKHDKPGGLCTSWRRQEYTIDGCLHWLVGSRPGDNFHRIWQELDAVQGRRMVERERQARIILSTAETEIAEKFALAAKQYERKPGAMHLRGMNMLFEGLKEEGSMIIVPSSALETMNRGAMGGLAAMSQVKSREDETRQEEARG